MKKRFGIFIIVILINSIGLSGQTIPFKNYTGRDGLPSRSVYDIAQDTKGYIWLATELGLAKFDGYNFKTFTEKEGLGENSISCVFVDKSGKIWVGGYNGTLSYLYNNEVKQLAYDSTVNPTGISEIIEDADNTIWASTYNGLFYVRNDSLFHFSNGSFYSEDIALCHLIDSKGNFWYADLYGLFLLENDTVLNKWPELEGLIIRDILEDKQGNIWFATQEAGVICYNGDAFTYFNEENGLSTNITLSLAEDNAGNIWVGTYFGGLFRINQKKIEPFTSPDLEECMIFQLLFDSNNRLWAKTLTNGLFLIDDNDQITHINKENGLADNNVSEIKEDHSGNIWVCTETGGVSKLGKYDFTVYKDNLVGNSTTIYSIGILNNGDILAGSYEGLNVLNTNGVVRTYSIENGLPDSYIISIIRENNNMVWLGTSAGLTLYNNSNFIHYKDSLFITNQYNIWSNDLAYYNNKIYAATIQGLIVFDGKEYKLFDENQGLIYNELYAVTVDPTGNIWCGSTNGLSIWDGSVFHNYTEADGLADNICNDICFDSKGLGWIATENGISAVTLDKGFNLSTRNYTKNAGLRSGKVNSVISDLKDNLWIGHNEGVDYLDVKNNKITNYGYNEGFIPLENSIGAIGIDREQNVWFGTLDGIVRYNPGYDLTFNDAPRLYITSIELYKDSTRLDNFYTKTDSATNLPIDLVLPNTKRNLFFRYVGLHYTIPDNNQYKYRLLGYENSWSNPTADIQTIPYQKLPHGKYTFQVLASNCDGVWTNQPAEFTFEILPPWWKTWWARSLQLFFIIFSFFMFVNLRERKLKHDKKVLIQKVKERTLEIEKQKDKIEEQKQEITDSIQYAQHIQSALLPKDDTIKPLLKEYFILYKPRDIVSGDFYWIDEKDGKTIAIAADCTGHGVPGAFMSMLGVSILNQVTASGSLNAGEILDNLRQQIISTLSHTKANEEARDGMDIAMCIIDYKKNKAQFAGAYNPLVLVRDSEAIVYKGDKMPVGLHSGEMNHFQSIDIEIQKGDCLYMFSDGYADQFGGHEGKKFMSAVFRKLLCNISSKPMPEQQLILDKTIENWKEGYEQVDDILVMGIRI
ncbi:MAG: SpoIIE family protein phosphatase [Bacteroidales bacterium]|nr:SpoIIE family protein phosphatase [Bacteroidales bacterium]MBN2819460.1 SpoIIE family protein phosphatase [Bacteroidales bacterium]